MSNLKTPWTTIPMPEELRSQLGWEAPVKVLLPRVKMVELDLLAAQALTQQLTGQRITIQECFEEVQAKINGYLTALTHNAALMPEDRQVRLHIQGHTTARFIIQ